MKAQEISQLEVIYWEWKILFASKAKYSLYVKNTVLMYLSLLLLLLEMPNIRNVLLVRYLFLLKAKEHSNFMQLYAAPRYR